VVRNNFK